MSAVDCKFMSFEATIEDINNNFTMDNSEMSRNVYKLSSLAQVIARDTSPDTLKSTFRNITGIREGQIHVQDLLKSMFGTTNWKAVAKSNDKDIILAFETKYNQMIKLAIESGAKPSSFSEDVKLTEAFLEDYEPFLYAEKSSRFIENILSGEVIRKLLPADAQKKWDGLIQLKDKAFRRNPKLDPKRLRFKKVTDDIEISVLALSDRVAKLFSDNPSSVVSPAQANVLLKYLGAEYQDEGRKSSSKDRLEPLKRAMKNEFNITEPEKISQGIKDLERVYETWQKLNYGVSGDIKLAEESIASTKKGEYNPRDHQDSVLGFLYQTGDNIVDQLLNSNLTYHDLHDTQRLFLEKYGDGKEDEIKAKWGDRIVVDPAKIRKGYVPMSKVTEMEDLVGTLASKDIFSNLDMLKERPSTHKESEPFQDSISSMLELVRFVASDVSQYTFAKEVKIYTTRDAKGHYLSWQNDRGVGNHELESGIFERYHEYILGRFEKRKDANRKNRSEVFQNFKKWTIAGMAVQGTMPLMDSALNNVVQAVIARFNTISIKQYLDYGSTTKSSKISSDPVVKSIADRVTAQVENKVRGRNADFVLHDVDMTVNSKALKTAFEIAEGSIRYGHLAPAALFIKGMKQAWTLGKGESADTSRMKDTILSMSGSEQVIRNFNVKVAMNQIVAMYKVQDAGGDTKFSTFNEKQMNDWIDNSMKSNQYYFGRLEEELHGNFTKDTKPFSAYKLGDAETTADLLVGLGSAQFYMFRQATMFGLLGAVGSLAKSASGAKNLKINSSAAFASSLILTDFLYEYYSDMFADNPIRFSALNAVNQIDPLVGGAEALHAIMAPMFDIPVTQKQYDTITEKLVRFGAGMTRGTLSEDENNKPFLEQLTGMLDITAVAAKSLDPVKLTFDMITQGVNTSNVKEFKERMRNRGTGWAPVDNILGPGNDFIRFFLKSTMAASAAVTNGKHSERDKQSYLRVNLMKSLLLGKIGAGFYTFDNTVNLRSNNASSYITQNNMYAAAKGNHIKDRDAANYWMENYNQVDKQINHDDLKIARELYDKYPVYVAFFKCDTEMIISMLEQISRGIRLTRNVLETNYKYNITKLQEKLDGYRKPKQD